MTETRYYNITNDENLEFRDDTLEVSGYGIVFGTESRLLGDFKEVISQRALDGVDMTDVLLLSQHKMEDILARTDSGTLVLSVTDKGVHFRASLPDTTLGRDTFTLIKRGDLKDMSFGFTVENDTWNTMKTPNIRTVNQIGKLVELSIVTRGAYKEPGVNKRSEQLRDACAECTTEYKDKKAKSLALKDEMLEMYNEIKKD